MTGPAPGAPADGALDHVVINVLRRMDEAADLFAALGFRLTPRGHHSLGSVNHLMMTAGPGTIATRVSPSRRVRTPPAASAGAPLALA